MDVLPRSKAEGDESPEDLPKCFRGIAALRRNVNTKRVLAGDKRFALWNTLDEFVDATRTLADTPLKRIGGESDDGSEVIKALQEQVRRLLADFNAAKELYEKLDAELVTIDDRLADEEIRIYKHLGTASGPPPSIYGHSFPLRSLPEQPPSQDDLAYGEPSDDGTDPFESQYGMGASVGMYPRLAADLPQNSSFDENPVISTEKKIEPDITITDPRRDKGVSSLVEQNSLLPDPNGVNSEISIDYVADDSESSVLFGPTPEPHPLILDNRSPDRLESYLLDFNNKTERINQWLLHILRTSPLEIVGLRNSYDYDPMRVPMDEAAWAKHVLECWPQDNCPASSDLGPYTKGAAIYESVGSIERDLGSGSSGPLDGGALSPVDTPTQLEPSKPWHLVSPKDYESPPDPLAFTNPHHSFNKSRSINNLNSRQAVAERSQWPTSAPQSQVLSRGIQRMYRGTMRGIKMPFEKKHRPKILLPWKTAKIARKNKPYFGKTRNSSTIVNSGHDKVDKHSLQLSHRTSSTLTVSPSGRTESTSHPSTLIDSSGNVGPGRDWLPLPGEDLSSPHRYKRPLLEAVHTKSLFAGQVFLLSIKSLVDLDPISYRYFFSILEEPYPTIVSLIVIRADTRVGFLTACPLLINASHELNPLQNKYRDFVVHFDVPEYFTTADVHVRLTHEVYHLPQQKQLRLNSTVQFTIPFGVPTLAIGQIYPRDLPKIYQNLEDPKQHANYLPSRLLSALARDGFGQLYSFDKGYASSVAYIEPDLFWSTLSSGSHTPDESDLPRYSTVY